MYPCVKIIFCTIVEDYKEDVHCSKNCIEDGCKHYLSLERFLKAVWEDVAVLVVESLPVSI
jgi:hypothetical protein